MAVADTRMPNAFALGRSPKSATVCATTGIMELLSPAELEGVMAHELTHVANRDVLVMTLAGFFATIAAYIVQFGFFFGGGGGYGDDDDNPSFMVLFLVSIAVYIISFFLMQALSRYREFAADRGAAVITGRPSALASALMKISSGMERIPQQDLRASSELSAFYIFPPGVKGSISGLFATHPPMEKRIEALQRLESQLQGAARNLGGRWASSTSSPASARSRAGAGPRVRDGDGRPCARDVEWGSEPGRAAIVFQPLATSDFDSIVADMEEVLKGTGDEMGTTIEKPGRQVRLPLDGHHRPRLRGSRGRDQRRFERPAGRRLRGARARRGVRVPRLARQARLLDL